MALPVWEITPGWVLVVVMVLALVRRARERVSCSLGMRRTPGGGAVLQGGVALRSVPRAR
ncbi:hypothetical protein KNE206_30690 [Kitasatospora sp. NE20-6]